MVSLLCLLFFLHVDKELNADIKSISIEKKILIVLMESFVSICFVLFFNMNTVLLNVVFGAFFGIITLTIALIDSYTFMIYSNLCYFIILVSLVIRIIAINCSDKSSSKEIILFFLCLAGFLAFSIILYHLNAFQKGDAIVLILDFILISNGFNYYAGYKSVIFMLLTLLLSSFFFWIFEKAVKKGGKLAYTPFVAFSEIILMVIINTFRCCQIINSMGGGILYLVHKGNFL